MKLFCVILHKNGTLRVHFYTKIRVFRRKCAGEDGSGVVNQTWNYKEFLVTQYR